MNHVRACTHCCELKTTAGLLRHTAALFITILCTVMMSTAAKAADLAQLYSGEVLVGEQAATESQLVRQAFLAMLVKLTGSNNPAALPGVSDGLGEVSRMASRVGFVSFNPPEALRPSLVTTEGRPAQRLFRASFSPTAVDQWLRLRQIPRWSPERPSLQLWLAYEQPDGSRQLIFDHDDPLRWWLQSHADQRGLPVEWPLALRLFDPQVYQQAIAATWGGFQEDLPGVTSSRDGTDSKQFNHQDNHLLLAAAQALRDSWRVRWRLFSNGQLSTYITEAENLAVAMEQGVQRAADQMAQRAMIVDLSGQDQILLVRVHDVRDTSDYGRIMQTLRQLSQTVDLQVTQARPSHQGGVLELRLQARAGEDWLRQALRVSQWLEILPSTTVGGSVELRLRR